MSKTNYKLPGLPKLPRLGGSKGGGKAKTSASSFGVKKISTSLGDRTSVPALNFGPHPKTTSSSTSPGSQWSSLAGSAKSGGLAGVFAGPGGFGGIGSILNGISNLFGGGQSTPAPLVPYVLPLSQVQNVVLGGVVPVNAGNLSAVSKHAPTTVSAAPLQIHNEQIIQAVKQALLTSSTLNDIIAEI